MFFNQAGMGVGMNPFDLPQVPTVAELWKNEKSKYRHWMVLFGIAILVMTALAIVAMVLNIANIDNMAQKIVDWSQKKYANKEDWITLDDARTSVIWQQIVLMNGLQVVGFVVGLSLFATTLVTAYKHKNFAKLSKWSTFVVGLSAFMAIINLISMAWKGGISDYITGTPAGIYTLIFYILAIVVWLLVSSPVARIRRVFALSDYVEQRRKDPVWQQQKAQYEAMMKAAGQINPGAFGASAFGPTAAQPEQAAAPADNQAVTPATPEVEPERKRLEGLSEAKLKKVAKELSISGADNMKKDELIEAILRVTKGDK